MSSKKPAHRPFQRNYKKIPEDDPFKQLMRDIRKSDTIEGLIEMAQEGDKSSIRSLFEEFMLKVQDESTPCTELMEYFASCFSKIVHEGQSADVAFGLKRRGKRGRRSAHLDGRILRDRIGFEVMVLIAQGSSREEAIREIAKRHSKGYKTVEAYYREYTKDPYPK